MFLNNVLKLIVIVAKSKAERQSPRNINTIKMVIQIPINTNEIETLSKGHGIRRDLNEQFHVKRG